MLLTGETNSIQEAVENMDNAEQRLRRERAIAHELSDVRVRKSYQELKEAVLALDELLLRNQLKQL